MIKVMLKKIVLTLSAMLLVVCTSDPKIETPPTVDRDEMAEVILQLRSSNKYTNQSMQTHALTASQESEVTDIHVLVFDENDELIDIREAESVQNGSFSVTLPASVRGEMFNLSVLANVDELFAGVGYDVQAIAGGRTDRQAIVEALYIDVDGPLYTDDMGTIPMWGETGPIELTQGANIHRIELIRSLARVDVGVGVPIMTDDATRTYEWTGLDEDGEAIPFELTGVYVVRPNDRYAVMPLPENLDPLSEVASELLPTVPPGTGQFTLDESKQLFSFTNIQDQRYLTRNIYLPSADVIMGGSSEDGNHTNRMAIVIGGRYNGSSDVNYYRVDFAEGTVLDDVLRNHLYRFNIVGVTGPGYATVEDAYSNDAMNMVVNVVDWDESKTINMYVDGSYFFAISDHDVVFEPFGGQTFTAQIRTNVSEFSMSLDKTTYLVSGDTPSVYQDPMTGYRFTLERKAGKPQEYTLTVECTRSNVSDFENVGARKQNWSIRMASLLIPFSVDQQWRSEYISIRDKQTTFLFPEGTDGEPIPIEIVSTTPVAMDCDAGWVRWNEVADLTQDTDGDGLYSAKLSIEVDPFPYADNSGANRVANIQIAAVGKDPIVYLIDQEAPYLYFNRTNIYVTRPASGGGQRIVHPINLFSNIKPEELRLYRVPVGEQSEDEWIGFTPEYADPNVTDGGRLESGFDARRPRYGRFEVAVDFAQAPEKKSVSVDFFVAPVVEDYGDLKAHINILTPADDDIFQMTWYRATFLGRDEPVEWVPRHSDNDGAWIFPWNTTGVEFDMVSNRGIFRDPTTTMLSTALLLGPSDGETSSSGVYREVTYQLQLNNEYYNTPSNYIVGFKSDVAPPPIPTFDAQLRVRQGIQVWRRTDLPNDAAVSANGYPSSSPAEIVVTNNIMWRALSDAEWLTMQTSDTPTFVNEITHDGRVYTPESVSGNYETQMYDVLVNKTPLLINVAPWNEFNPIGGVNYRTGHITFENMDYDEEHFGASLTNSDRIIVTQWAHILRPLDNSHLAPLGGKVPRREGVYPINVSTNMVNWVVRVYDRLTGSLLASSLPYTGLNIDSGPSAVSTDVNIPQNNERQDRALAIYLYEPQSGQEVSAGEWTQRMPNWAFLPPPTTDGTWQFLAPPGILGVDAATGQLTLRGSGGYASLANGGTYGTPSGTVYGVYFKWNSLVGIGSETTPNVAWAPDRFNVDNMRNSVIWGDIPHADPAAPVYLPTTKENEAIGRGDPCRYVDDADGNAPYHMAYPMDLAGYSFQQDQALVQGMTGALSGTAYFPYQGYRAAGTGARTGQPNLGSNGRGVSYVLTRVADGAAGPMQRVYIDGSNNTVANPVAQSGNYYDEAYMVRCIRD